jgi:DNA-binding response OmpR family regulator
VLVVDDEPQIRQLVVRYLAADGLRGYEAGEGAAALRVVEEHGIDCVILDIGLPGMDGLEVLRELRRRTDVFVIMLTARAEEVDRVVGLSVGADDYVTKPFSPRELVARVRAVLRRGPRTRSPGSAGSDTLAFDELSIDRAQHTVTCRGTPVALTALEFDLLAALASAPGRVFTRQQLLERVWGYDFFGDERVVDVHIRNIRHALDDDADHPAVIGTLRGVGYRLIAHPLR